MAAGDTHSAPTTVGVLGGGQLARMLAEAGRALGLRVAVLAEEPDAPAAQVADEVVVGALDDERALRALFSRVGVATFENEFVVVERLRAARQGTGAALRPSLEAIATGQDKLAQKRLFERLGIPTAPFLAFDAAAHAGLEAFLDAAYATLGGEPVFKWARMGYDGKGVLSCEGTSAIAPDRARARTFCAAALARGLPLYAERRIAFRREVALVAARSTTDEFRAFPLVVTVQRDGVCFQALGPATALGVAPEAERRAQDHARRIAEALGYAGVLAVELFETDAGDLLVNEIAPRVHNSGHVTQASAATSQFEQHWRAVLGMPLGSVEGAPAYAMQNLLGPAGVARDLGKAPPPLWDGPGRFHWYGKREVRPGRKVGHVNAVAEDAARLAESVAALDAGRVKWEGRLREG